MTKERKKALIAMELIDFNSENHPQVMRTNKGTEFLLTLDNVIEFVLQLEKSDKVNLKL